MQRINTKPIGFNSFAMTLFEAQGDGDPYCCLETTRRQQKYTKCDCPGSPIKAKADEHKWGIDSIQQSNVGFGDGDWRERDRG